MLRTRLVAALAPVLAVTGCGGGSPSTSSTGTQFDGATLPARVQAPDFALTDQGGHAVSLSAQRGHVTVLGFLWADCRTCLLVAQQIRGALDELGHDANVRTLLVEDSRHHVARARAAAFLESASLAGRATYLTGSRARLQAVWSAFHVPQPATEDAITIVLIDRRGYERVGFGVEQITPESLAHDIRLLTSG